MGTDKKPVVDEKRKMQEDLEEHAQLLKVYGENLRCDNPKCNKPVSASWDACPNCGETGAHKADEA